MVDKLMHKVLELGEGGEEQYRMRVPKTFQPYRPVLADLTAQLLGYRMGRGNALSGRVVINFECR